jgi:hypothetical protein
MASGWKSSYFRYRELFLNASTLYKKRADLRAFLEIVMSIFAVIIFLIFALKPTALTIIELIKQINEKKETLSTLSVKVNNLQKAGALMAQNEAYLNDIDIAIPSAPNPEILTKQVEGIAAKNGVELMGFAIDNVILTGNVGTIRKKTTGSIKPLPENANEMGYTISVKGGFVGVNGFLKDLEDLRVISVVDSAAINSSVTNTEKFIVAVISGRVPYLQSSK